MRSCVDVLLRAGADIEALRRCVQQSPLMLACEHGHAHIVQDLLTAGASINRQTQVCSAALIIACHYGQQQVVDILLGMLHSRHI